MWQCRIACFPRDAQCSIARLLRFISVFRINHRNWRGRLIIKVTAVALGGCANIIGPSKLGFNSWSLKSLLRCRRKVTPCRWACPSVHNDGVYCVLQQHCAHRQHANTHSAFYRLNALPVSQPTVSKHRHDCRTLVIIILVVVVVVVVLTLGSHVFNSLPRPSVCFGCMASAWKKICTKFLISVG